MCRSPLLLVALKIRQAGDFSLAAHQENFPADLLGAGFSRRRCSRDTFPGWRSSGQPMTMNCKALWARAKAQDFVAEGAGRQEDLQAHPFLLAALPDLAQPQALLFREAAQGNVAGVRGVAAPGPGTPP